LASDRLLYSLPKAFDITAEELMNKDPMTDLKLYIGDQSAEMRAELRNLQFVILATWSTLLVAIGVLIKYLMP
jgi:hypothetical protein